VLGVVLDQRLTFEKYATAVAKSCNYHAQAIRHIRHLLTPDLVQTLACSLILSRIDYCNALLHGVPAATIHKLQRVQNNAARIVLQAPRRSDAKPLLRRLHWLPVEQRIMYKTDVLAFKVRNCNTYLPTPTPTSAATYRCGTVLRAFARLALHCWHNLPGERTSQHGASVTRHLVSGTHFLGQYLIAPH